MRKHKEKPNLVEETRINKAFSPKIKGRSILTTSIYLIVLAIALSSLIAVSAVSVNALSTEEIINKIKGFIYSTPKIESAWADPVKVLPDQIMTTNVIVKDKYGVKEIIAEIPHENGVDIVNLHLIEGDQYYGTWQNAWKEHSAKNEKWYTTRITVINKKGVRAYAFVDWQDPTVSHPASQVTAGTFDSGDFVFPDSLEVTDNLTVDKNLTVDAGVLHVDATNDRVGIGTTSPYEVLVLDGPGTDGTAADRKVLHFEDGGWADPSDPDTLSNGDKIIFYNQSTYKTAIGMKGTNGIWMQAHGTDTLLEVWGGAADAAPTEKFTLTTGGNLDLVGTCDDTGTGTCASDIAEKWHSVESIKHTSCSSINNCSLDEGFVLEFEDGDVVCAESGLKNIIRPCNGAYDSMAISVVSYNASFTIGPKSNPYPVSLAGNVAVKVICDNPINIGDSLVSAHEQGWAMKLDASDVTSFEEFQRRNNGAFAKALEPCESGRRVIRAWI